MHHLVPTGQLHIYIIIYIQFGVFLWWSRRGTTSYFMHISAGKLSREALLYLYYHLQLYTDNKIPGTNMGPIWVLSAPDRPRVGSMNLAIWVYFGIESHSRHGKQPFWDNRDTTVYYRKISNISRTKSQNLNDSRIVLQLSLPNPLKSGVKSRMKM